MIYEGETIRLRARYYSDGVLTAPVAPVSVYVRKREQDAVTAFVGTASSSSTGVYEIEHATGDAGVYDYSFETANGIIEEADFTVHKRRSQPAP